MTRLSADPAPPPTGRLKPTSVLLGTLVLPAVIFGALAERVLRGEGIPGDAATYRAIETEIADLGTPIGAHALLTSAAVAGVASLVVAALVLLRRHRLRELAFVALGIAGMLALDPVLKELFQRPPMSPDGSGYSFPSGTAMVSLAAAGAVVVLVKPPLLRLAAIVVGGLTAVALGIAVVYLRWHYPSDVVAGWCLAFGWLSALWIALLVPARRSAAPSGLS